MTLRGLLRGSLLYTLGNFLPRVAAFALLPVYTAAMSPAGFGIFSLMLSLIGVLVILYRLGLDGALLRLHFDVAPRRRPALYTSMAVATLLAVVLLSALVGLLTAPVFDRIFRGVPFVPYGLLALATAGTTAFQYIPSALYRATERPERFVAFSAAAFVIGAVASLFFLLVLRLGAVGGLLGQLVAGIAVMGATGLILLRLRRRRVDRSLIRAGLSFGLPLVPHGLAGWVLNLSDRWLIGLLIGLPTLQAQAAVGIYSLGYALAQGVSLAAISFNAAWIPFFYARGEGEHGPGLLREMTTLTYGGLALLAAVVAVFGRELTDLLATARWGPSALVAADVIPVVALASLIYGLYFMVVSPIFLLRRTRVLPLLTLGAGVANVVANLVLIPRIGIMGAAWSTLLGYLILTTLTYLYARSGYPLELDLRRLAIVTIGIVGAIALSRLQVVPGNPGMTGVGWHAAIALVFGVGLLQILRAPVRRLRGLVAASGSQITEPEA